MECDRKTELAKRRLKETQEELSEEAAAKVKPFRFVDKYFFTSGTFLIQV